MSHDVGDGTLVARRNVEGRRGVEFLHHIVLSQVGDGICIHRGDRLRKDSTNLVNNGVGLPEIFLDVVDQ